MTSPGDAGTNATTNETARAMKRASVWILLAAIGCSPNAGAPSTAAPSPAASTAEQPTLVRGRILGHGGEPLRAAHARLTTALGSDPVAVAIAADGAFSMETDRRGLAKLSVTATDHAAIDLIVVLDGAPVDVTVRLGTYPRAEPLDDVSMIWWAGDPASTEPEAAALEKQSDGTWRVRVKTDAQTVRYQIGGTSGAGRVVNGPTGDRFEEDGGGDYRSVIQVEGGAFEVVVEPAALPPAGAEPTVQWTDADSTSSRLWNALAVPRREFAAFEQALNSAVETNPGSIAKVVKDYDWSVSRKAALDALEREKNPHVRHAIIGEYFRMGEYDVEKASARDRELAVELLGDMPGDDAGWALFPIAMVTAVELSGDPKHQARYETLLDEELPADLAAEFLFGRLLDARADEDLDAARALFARLQRPDRFGGSVLAQVAKQYDPDGALAPGKIIPSFAIPSLKGKKKKGKATVRDTDLRGKVYLVDLWATWCVPCVAEMDGLHAAFEKYGRRRDGKTRPFGIFSISLDEDPSVVTEFRKEFPMPWEHGHLGFEGAMQTFGVAQIPFAILVDEQGKILASGSNLLGARLQAELDKHLAAQ